MKPLLTHKQFPQHNLTSAHLDELAEIHEGLVELFMENQHPSHDHSVLGVGLADNPQPSGRDDRLVFVMLVDHLTPRARLRLPTKTPQGWRIHHHQVGQIRALGVPAAPVKAGAPTPTPAAGATPAPTAAPSPSGSAVNDTSTTASDPAIYRSPIRPVPGGVSIAPILASGQYSGTLGCEVATTTPDPKGNIVKKFMLSNNHVLANCNALSAGAPISQPSQPDGGNAGNKVATLGPFVPLTAGGTSPVDAAMAAYVATDNHTPKIQRDASLQGLGIGITASSVNLAVQKSGRTTGHTLGTIAATALTVKVSYGAFGNVTIANAFSIVGTVDVPAFAAAGDSGSLITDQAANHPVGLLFATSTSGTPTTYANNIQAVLDNLTVVAGVPVSIVYS